MILAEESPTPTPTPTEDVSVPVDFINSIDTNALVLYALIGIIVMGSALLMSLALSRASKHPPPAALITALSMLTLFSVAGGIATNNDEAWTIAAAGVGALAGSVTSMFQDARYQEKLEERQSAIEVQQAELQKEIAVVAEEMPAIIEETEAEEWPEPPTANR